MVNSELSFLTQHINPEHLCLPSIACNAECHAFYSSASATTEILVLVIVDLVVGILILIYRVGLFLSHNVEATYWAHCAALQCLCVWVMCS